MRPSLLAEVDSRDTQAEEKVVALIAKEPPVEKREQLNIRIDPTVGELLGSYCESIASGQHYVVEQALRYTLRSRQGISGLAQAQGNHRRGEEKELQRGQRIREFRAHEPVRRNDGATPADREQSFHHLVREPPQCGRRLGSGNHFLAMASYFN
jgi:hypothetical protein